MRLMEVTLTVPDDLATRLRPVKDQLPQILELGLRELHSTPPSYEGLSDVLEALARLPSPEEVMALRPRLPFRNVLRLSWRRTVRPASLLRSGASGSSINTSSISCGWRKVGLLSSWRGSNAA